MTDAIEVLTNGYSSFQLWLNYVAFLPMPWLLLGVCMARGSGDRAAALIGALLYGAAFTYFAHTALAALQQHVPTYESLWQSEGRLYTVHGGLMIVGGSLFAWSAWRDGWLPRAAILLFSIGLAINLLLACAPIPDAFQVIGSLARNARLVAMGFAILTEAGDQSTDADSSNLVESS
ncbi:MAG: hypothetical protein ACKVW3_12755 [Phycisphaerales bacterium]